MNGLEFHRNVLAEPNLEWLGVVEARDKNNNAVLVKNKKTGSVYAVDVAGIVDANSKWDEYLKVLLGKRSASIMNHMSRIVGYFSLVKNWNRSKVAELHDRQKGSYTVLAETPGEKIKTDVTPFVSTFARIARSEHPTPERLEPHVMAAVAD